MRYTNSHLPSTTFYPVFFALFGGGNTSGTAKLTLTIPDLIVILEIMFLKCKQITENDAMQKQSSTVDSRSPAAHTYHTRYLIAPPLYLAISGIIQNPNDTDWWIESLMEDQLKRSDVCFGYSYTSFLSCDWIDNFPGDSSVEFLVIIIIFNLWQKGKRRLVGVEIKLSHFH